MFRNEKAGLAFYALYHSIELHMIELEIIRLKRWDGGYR